MAHEEGVYVRTDLNWRAQEIGMLKSNYEVVGRNAVRCFTAVQNVLECEPFKTSSESIFF